MSSVHSLVLISLLAAPACAQQHHSASRSADTPARDAAHSGVPEGDHTGSDPSQPPTGLDEGDPAPAGAAPAPDGEDGSKSAPSGGY